MEDLPSGTVTFLFTDIEDSSRMWDQHPLQMRVALEQHDSLLVAAIEANGGYVFTTAGDSFAAAFETADAAAQAALEIQRSTSSAEWDETTPIRVRIGLHTGEAHERGGDYFGPAVNRCARIEAAGHGDQILVSGATATVLAQSTTAVWDLTDLGQHSLKGLTQPDQIHQLGPGRHQELRTADFTRTNIPAAGTDLIGRDEAIAHVVELCESERLVTLTGLGGIGKTSLARQVASELLESHGATDVWWCDLVSVRDEDLASTIGSAIGMETSGPSIEDVVATLRRRGTTRLVLDNCEHVIEAAAAACGQLMTLGNVSILATSRLPLSLPNETLAVVTPLDVETSAIELLHRGMGRVGAPLPTTAADRDLAKTICRRVDGIPLALELVGARCRTLSLTDIERRLERLLSTTSPGGTRADDRHRTMTSAIEWSIDLLEPAARQALGALVVFPSAFDLESADAILDIEEIDTFDAFETCVASSLVEIDRSGSDVRYRVLGPIKQYAEQHLWRDPEATRNAHMEHFLTRLEHAHDALGSHDYRPYMTIRDDISDLAAVHRWALDSNQIDQDLRIYPRLSNSWMDIGPDVFGWSVETAARQDIEGRDGWGALWVCNMAFQIQSGNSEGVQRMIDRFGSISKDDPTYDVARMGLANTLGIFTGADWGRALEIHLGPAPRATAALVNYYFFGALSIANGPEELTGHSSRDAVDAAVTRLDEGLGWAASVGALNYEASMLEALSNVHTRSDRYQEGVATATRAEELAESLGMAGSAALSRFHHAVGILRGADSDRDVFELVLSTLKTAVEHSNEPAGAYAAKIAARFLAVAGHNETAALCIQTPDIGFADIVPDLGLELITDDAHESARQRNASLSILDIAAMALDELDGLDEPPVLPIDR